MEKPTLLRILINHRNPHLWPAWSVYSPAVVFRGVDGAVGQVGASTDFRQALGVEEGPGTPAVGGKL